MAAKVNLYYIFTVILIASGGIPKGKTSLQNLPMVMVLCFKLCASLAAVSMNYLASLTVLFS